MPIKNFICKNDSIHYSYNFFFEIAKHNNFIQNVICLASFGFCSIGQQGHFNLCPTDNLFKASLEIQWPQVNLMGGLVSVVCCLRIGQAKIEWYLLFGPTSISIGNSSFLFHTPATCLCCITLNIKKSLNNRRSAQSKQN